MKKNKLLTRLNHAKVAIGIIILCIVGMFALWFFALHYVGTIEHQDTRRIFIGSLGLLTVAAVAFGWLTFLIERK